MIFTLLHLPFAIRFIEFADGKISTVVSITDVTRMYRSFKPVKSPVCAERDIHNRKELRRIKAPLYFYGYVLEH
jgi:hypothetical protein